MRKRNLIVLTLVGAMSLAVTGCSNHTYMKKGTDTTELASERADEPSGTKENNVIETESQEPPSETNPPASETETTAEKEEVEKDEQEITTEVAQETTKPTEQETPKATEPQTEQQTTEKSVETQAPKQEEVTTEEPTTQKPATEDVATEEATTEQPTIERADADDCEAIADKVIEYINSYRETPATKLPGLTVYAQYRSRQLVSNFAHDTFDERAAATALQYGTYIDPSIYGIEGEPYYTAGAREAIAGAGYAGDINYVAEQIALLVKGSQGHWCYVGSSEYPYIAVGVTYESGMWYCDIAMAMENTDNN